MKCKHCGIEKNLIKSSKTNGKQYYLCNKCNTERLREYRKTKKGIEASRKAVRKYENKNQERKKAWSIAYYNNIEMKPCIICRKMPSHRHHPDIKKPKFIIFLCPYHHKQAHAQ